MIIDNKFFSKVFMWMFIGLAITFITGFGVSLNANMLYNIFSKYYIILAIVEVALVIYLSTRIRKMTSMKAKIMFCLYSFITGLTFSSIFVVYELTSIMYVFGITSIIFLIFSLIGNYTKLDLTKVGTYLLMILIGIVICTIINIFFKNTAFDLVLIILCLIVFIVYVAYDIQVIKNNLYMIDDEDNLAIYGALQLYLDFINIFIRLLRLFAKERD